MCDFINTTRPLLNNRIADDEEWCDFVCLSFLIIAKHFSGDNSTPMKMASFEKRYPELCNHDNKHALFTFANNVRFIKKYIKGQGGKGYFMRWAAKLSGDFVIYSSGSGKSQATHDREMIFEREVSYKKRRDKMQGR